jgi:plastocyanin
MRRLVAAMWVIAGSVFVATAAPAAAGGGGCHNPQVTEGSGTKVELRNNCFTPTVLRVAPGSSVTFVNADQVLHALSGINLGAYEEISSGASAQVRFDEAGTYPYMCHLHPSMTGAVIVDDAKPVLAGADRPLPPDDGGDLHPAPFALGGIVAGLALSFVLQKGRAART